MRIQHRFTLNSATISLAVAATIGGAAISQSLAQPMRGDRTRELPQVTGQSAKANQGWRVRPLVTIGEEGDKGQDLNEMYAGYRPVGILDGMAAYDLNQFVVRILVNHELSAARGYAYALSNGTELTGGRVSYFDINKFTRSVIGGGMAYDRIVDRAGNVVTSGTQINEGSADAETEGVSRPCSAYGIVEGEYGFENNIYLTGEEVGERGATEEEGLGGQEFALDVDNGVLYSVPMLGRAAFENVAPLDPLGSDKVVLMVGDDRGGAPLYLYIGQKGASPDDGTYSAPAFLRENGLGYGHLYAWVAEDGDVDPETFNGTGNSRDGHFVRIEHYEPENAGTVDHDSLGFISLNLQEQRAFDAGGFRFSRPEDLAPNPMDGTEVVLASTGRGSLFPSDNWGTTYLVDLDRSALDELLDLDLAEIDNIPAEISIMYDGDDAGGGQFLHPDEGLRSPDNLDWADDGYIYLQEDRSTSPSSLFGSVSGAEASIWQMNPFTGELMRTLEVNRLAVPQGQFDSDPFDVGDWETSGVVDVTNLFLTRPDETLLIINVQAHSLESEEGTGLARNAPQDEDLVQGGQLLLVSKIRD